MPQIDANNLARLRQIRQWSQLYAAVHVPNVLMTGTINDATIEREEMDIVFDNGAAGDGFTQALFDALDENTTLWVGSYAGGKDIGVIRVRSITRDAWPPVTGVIHVATNDGILFADDLYLTVLDEHRIWPKLPRVDVDEDTDPATITWWKDYDIVHDWQTHQEPPVVIMGPPACIFIDPTSGLATENFWGNDSYSPRGTALSGAILWTFPHGTPATQNTLGTEAAPHAVTWDTPGVYTVKLSITDANGRESASYRLVFVFDRSGANAPHQNFEIRNMRGNFSSGGWSANIRFFGDRVYGEEYDVEDFPVGTQVVIFAEDWYNSELVSIGGYGHREEIVFVGWIKSDTIRKEPITGEVSFQIHTVNGELQNCPSFPQTVERVTGMPASWLEIQNMTIDLIGFYLGYWHSTLYEVVDVLQSGDTSKIKFLDTTQTNLRSHLDKTVFGRILARALSDRQSRFKYDSNPQYLTDDVKPVTIMDLDPEDWLGRVDVQEIHENRVSWIDLSGVRVTDAEEAAPVFSLAPGEVPAPDGMFKQLDHLVIDDQDDGNFLAGRALADKNNPLPRTRVPLQGNYRIFDIQPQEWVTLDSLETLREGLGPEHETGTPWPTGTRFIPRDIDIGFRNDFGAFMVSMNMEAEVSGITGTAGYYPEDPPDDIPEEEDVDPPEDPPGDGGKVVIATLSQGMFRTGNIFAAVPTWEEINSGLSGNALKVNGFIRDPWSPSTTGIIYTEDGIYKSTNLRATTPTWTQKLSPAQLDTLLGTSGAVVTTMNASICQNGLVFATAGFECSDSGPQWIIRSETAGETWTRQAQLPGSSLWPNTRIGIWRANYAGAEAKHGALVVSSHNANNLWVFYSSACGTAFGRGKLVRSINKGVAVTTVNEGGGIGAVGGISFPYHNNADDQRMYLWQRGTIGTEYQSPDGGTTLNVISPPTVVRFKGMMGEHTWNENLVRAIGEIGAQDSNGELTISEDGTSSWSAGIDLGMPVWSAAGFPYNQQLMYFGRATVPVLANYPLNPNNPLVKVTRDQGASQPDKSGNLRADFNVKCIVTIVPDWTR